jgi:hypothetical protein
VLNEKFAATQCRACELARIRRNDDSLPAERRNLPVKALVLDSVSSPITRSVYNLGLDEFIAWFMVEPQPAGFTKATVLVENSELHENMELACPLSLPSFCC